MEHWEEFMDCTGKTFRVKTLSDENFSYDSEKQYREYLDISEYALAFYNNESDGEPIFAEATEMYIEDNDLYLTI